MNPTQGDAESTEDPALPWAIIWSALQAYMSGGSRHKKNAGNDGLAL